MISRFMIRGIVGFAAVFAAVLGASAVVSAQTDLSSELLDTIRSRCSNSQFALQQIEKRDAVSRINRGRAYDQMLRQVSAMNSRFAYNKVSSPDLIQITTSLQQGVDTFRAGYDRYDTDISDALKVNCKDKPADYYSVIVKARADRTAVGDQVNGINDLMKQYRDVVLRYKETAQ
jgi:LPS O-antigen subunit length determinant protein (WzzB/FepE family)